MLLKPFEGILHQMLILSGFAGLSWICVVEKQAFGSAGTFVPVFSQSSVVVYKLGDRVFCAFQEQMSRADKKNEAFCTCRHVLAAQ